MQLHPAIKKLLDSIELEEKEEIKRYQLDQHQNLRTLKAEGLAMHPISITRKYFGYADYPEFQFSLPYPTDTNFFKDNTAIECFLQGEEPVKATLLSMDGNKGECRLYAPDFPDWIEDNGVGIKISPDQRTTGIMKIGLKQLQQNAKLFPLFEFIHYKGKTLSPTLNHANPTIGFSNPNLNESQKAAVMGILNNADLCIIHGPPGTGKTTTLIESIIQLIKKGEKVLVSAPSNTAIDHIAKGLLKENINILRVGNINKTDEAIFSHTAEGKLFNSKQQKEIKELKIRAEEFRKMALKYKRSFGKAEREQRNLLFKEVKNIREEIKKLQSYNEEKLFAEAQVILGTPIGIYDSKIKKIEFGTLIIDEAGQCLEPLAWCIFPFAEKYVLGGDHLQLPPTVLSGEAIKLGFNKSILEVCFQQVQNIYLLNTQYRMQSSIADFSSEYFYASKLLSPSHLTSQEKSLTFIDTAGSGFQEKRGADGTSVQNEDELKIIKHLLTLENIEFTNAALISPYSGQVASAKKLFPKTLRISTIDSFQGQEKSIILLSLVRSNDDAEIGFLKDYRRMNVAITRAKNHLYVIGDSATIGGDAFYNAFLSYVEKHGNYRTVWEFEL